MDDLNGDDFDHSGLGFIHDGCVAATMHGGRPLMYQPVPEGTHEWGGAWKRALAETYNHAFGITIHGASMAAHANHLDLDPTCRDMFSNPLLRVTFDFPKNDKRMAAWITGRVGDLARAMGPGAIETGSLAERYSIVP